MKEFKGTKGPWNVQFGDEIHAGDGVDNEQVATANDCHDADLIAAAPELLKELQRAYEVYDALLSDGYVGYKDDAIRASAAIAKALGESK